MPLCVVLDAQETANPLGKPDGASARSPFDAHVVGRKPARQELGGRRGEPRRVGMHALMHGKPNTIGNVSRPEKMIGTHRPIDIQVLCPIGVMAVNACGRLDERATADTNRDL